MCYCIYNSGGLVGDQERYSTTTALLSKGLENWGDHQQAAAAASACMVGMKEEGSMAQSGSGAAAPYNFYGSHLAASDSHEIQAKSQLSQMIMASSPRSCVTTSLGSNMLDFSNSAVVPPPPELRNHHHHHSDNSSEVNINITCANLLSNSLVFVFLIARVPLSQEQICRYLVHFFIFIFATGVL